jgi:fibronectin-binding autotransporter adhesin
MKHRILSTARLSFPLAAALAAMPAAPAAFAQTNGTWDGGGGSAIWGGVNNWNPNGQIATGVGATATFGTAFTSGTNIQVNTNRTIGNINHNSTTTNITISQTNNSVFTLDVSSGSPTVTVGTAARTLTITAPISGNDGMTKAGAGTLVLSGTNLFSGTAIVSDGTLTLGNSLALQNAPLNTTSSILGTASAGLKTTATTMTLGGLSGDKNFAATGGVFTATSGGYGGVTALTLNPASGAPSYAGVIEDGAANMTLTKTGAGTQVLSGANAYTGTTTISAGTLQLGDAGTTGTLASASSIVNNATFAVNRTNAVVQGTDFSGAAITGTGGFTQAGSGTTTLNALNTFSGNVTVSGGTLVADNTETSGSGPLGAANDTRSITVASGATLQLAQGKALKALFTSTNIPSLVINGAVNDTNLSNPGNNPLGNVTLNNGTLAASVGNASGYGSYNLNGTLTSTGTSTISSTAPVPITLSAATGTNTTFAVTSGTLTVSAGLGEVTAAGDERISSLTKTGGGAMLLTAANTYTGGTNINAGTLTVTSTGSLANTAIATTGTGTFAATPGTGTVNLGNTGTTAAGASLNLGSGTVFSMVDGSAGGITNLVQEGSFAGPALTLDGASLNFELDGTSADKLAVTGAASLSGTNSINITPTGTLSDGTYDLITAASGLDTGGTLVFGGTGTTTQTLVSGTNSYLMSLNNAAGVESVTVGAPVTVTGGVTWTGQTNGSGADDPNWTHLIGSNWAVGSSAVVYSNGTAVTFDDTNAVTASGITNSTVNIAAGGVTPASSDFNHSLVDYTVGGGAIGGSGGLSKSGSGILTLNAANTYTGTTAINSGTLKLGNASAFGAGTGLSDGTTISLGATLDLGGVSNGANSAAGSERLTVSGTGVEGNGAIVSSSAIATPFIGVRYLTLAGDTTLGFSNRWDVGSSTAANNAFVGGGYALTFLGTGAAAQASLNFLGETDLGDINVNLGSDTATNILYLQGDTTLGQPGKTATVSGGSALAWWTNVTPTTYDKKFALDNGLLNFNKSNTTFTLPGTISLANSNTVTSNISTTSVIVSNEISGSGSLTKSGPGTLILAGANIYSGLTNVDAGVLRITDAGALGGTTNGVVVNGTNSGAATNARLELSGSIIVTGESATIKGNGNFLGALQSQSGSNEWAGNITIDADLTRIGAASGASLLVSGVIDDGLNDYRVMYRINDAAASVTLTGANTYTGGSSIVGAGPVIVGSLNSVVGGAASSHLGAPVTTENGKIIIGTTAVNGTLSYVGSGETTDRTVQIGDNATTPAVGDTGGAAIENNGTSGELVFSAPTFNIPTDAVTGTSPARTLTLGGSNTNANTISGIIQNNQIASSPTAAVNVTKTGAGSWTLAGANTTPAPPPSTRARWLFTTTDQSLTGGLTFGAANGGTNNGPWICPRQRHLYRGRLGADQLNHPNAISIGASKTLTLSGGLTLGYDAAGGTGQTDSMLTATGLGTMAVNGTTINISVNQAAVNAGYWSKGTLDVSGLAAFSTNVTNFNIGVGSTTHGPGDVMLSDTANTILATTLQVGVTGGNNGRGTSTLTLGTGTNVIQADTINIGRNKSSGPGVVKFVLQTAGSPGTVTIADKAGTGRANIDIANMVSTASGGGAIGNLDLRGHTATVSAGTVTMGNTAAASNSGSTNGTLSFDDGTFDVNTLNMAPKSGGGTGTARATLNIGGGTFTVNTAFTMGSQSGSGASAATVNLTGGTLSSSAPILKGAGTTTSTINLSGGTLDLNGNTIGSGGAAITLKAESGTLSNIASINGTGGLTKTTAGTLLLSGTISYAGDTTVSEGTLTLSSAPDPLNANTANDASTVTIAATGATLDLTYTGTDLVDKLFIGPGQMSAGIYGHSTSGATNGGLGVGAMDAYFGPGAGTLTVASGSNFASWITGTFANGSVPGGQQGPNDDPDNDGIPNLVEYAIAGQDPTVPNATIGTFINNTLSFNKRQPLASDITYAIQDSTDLGLTDAWAEVTGVPPAYVNDGTTISYTLTPGSPPTNFIRLQVATQP